MENNEFISLVLLILIVSNLALNNSKISELENQTAYLKTKISDLENKTKLVYIDNTERTYDRGHGNERNLMKPTSNQEFVWINENDNVQGFVTTWAECERLRGR